LGSLINSRSAAAAAAAAVVTCAALEILGESNLPLTCLLAAPASLPLASRC